MPFALERSMSKDEILTAYLNVAPFGRNHKGQNIAGAQQAAEGIFGIDANKLSIPCCLPSRFATESDYLFPFMKIPES